MRAAALDRLRAAWVMLRNLVRRETVDRELADEVAFHLAMETEKNIAAGMTPKEAVRAARVSFHGVERYREEARAARRGSVVQAIGRDLGMAAKTVGRSPGLAAIVVATLGLGIGASTAIFSVVNATVLRPLPWAEPERLVNVREQTPEGQPFSVSDPNYLDFRAAETVDLAAIRELTRSFTDGESAERLQGAAVTGSFFPVVGVPAALGRTFGGEDRALPEDVVVLSHDVWQRRFGGDPGIIGRRITLSGTGHVVTGVMPADFHFFDYAFWVPYPPSSATDRMDHWLGVVGRLAPGATVEQAEAELSSISAALAEAHPAMAGWSVDVRPLRDTVVGPEFRTATVVMAGAVALLLLMACANVANLLLAHATARRADLGVRVALGAGRGRVVRQLLTESLLLATGGAALGLLIAYSATSALRLLNPTSIPRVDEVAVDLPVLAFAAAAALATALLAGFLPALQASRTDAAAQLRDGARAGVSRSQRRVRDALVVGQVAVAVVLLLGAGLMVRSFLRLQAVDPGYDTQHTWAVRLHLPENAYDEGDRRYFAYRDIMESVERIPGVVSAAGSFVEPFSGMNLMNDVTPEERAAEFPDAGLMQAAWRPVTRSYFETMGVPLLDGRLFTSDDRYGMPATVIINRTLAERLWGEEEAVGRRLYWGGTEGEPRTVVGVVGDIRDVELADAAPPLMFISYQQLALGSMTLLVRTDRPVAGLGAAVREAVRSVDPLIVVPELRPVDGLRARSVAGPRFNALLLGTFAGVALLLAAVGLYGLLGFVVARRTREIGVRRALGAETRAVSRLVVGHGLRLAGTGIAAGLLAAFALTRVVESLLFETPPTDPLTYLAAPVLFGVVAFVASWIPARRAARVDPVIALRSE